NVDGDGNTLTASSANITGVSTTGAKGFNLVKVQLLGGVANGANVSLSSAGSGKRATNVIGSSIFNADNTLALLKKGIENNTQVNASGLSLGGNGDEPDWNVDYTSSDSAKSGNWIFDGAEVSKTGNITLQGVGFINSNLSAKNLSLNTTASLASLTNTVLNATGGNITLEGVNLVNSNVTANSNLLIDNKEHELLLQNSTLNSISGNITLRVDSSEVDTNGGIKLIDTNLSASNGEINVSAVSKSVLSDIYNTSIQTGGLVISGNNTFSARDSRFSGEILNNVRDTYTGAIFIKSVSSPTNINISGNATFTGKDASNTTSGIFTPLQGVNISVTNGNLTLNASGLNGISTAPVSGQYADSGMRFNLTNANVSIEATGKNDGIGKVDWGNDSSGLTFSGTGNVSVNATGQTGMGINTNRLVNKNLTGHTSITGKSEGNKAGISVSDNVYIDLTNATVTGKSISGEGISINALGSGAQGANVAIHGGTVTGVSEGALSGINITGKNINVSNQVKLTGTSVSGDGVKLNATDVNYTLDGALIHGTSTSGNGVNLGGSVNARGHSSIIGNTTTGFGVTVSGNLTNGEHTTISGDASSTGQGIYLNGTVNNGTLTGESTRSQGVLVGNSAQVNDAKIIAKTRSLSEEAMAADPDVVIPNTVKEAIEIVESEPQKLARLLESLANTNPEFLAELIKKNPGLLELLKGDTGAAGPQGEKGEKGDTGAAGPQGEKGDITPPFPASLSRAVYEQQSQVTRSDQLKGPVESSGYREASVPVKVEICSDGECRSLDVENGDTPHRP
ncbi:TPA: hypothetical protein K8C06_004143, partial [Salmonella enterica subsp. enterica serovar Welikade]|nr:hypothetical protein [Salmonella enterica subsp. enterica serovar Welikade]